MKVLAIIGCVLLYILFGTMVSVVGRNVLDDDIDLVFASFLWPVFVVFCIFWLVFCTIPKIIIEKIEERRQ